MEAVVGSGGFGHLLHDHLGLHILLRPGIYRDVGPLKTHRYGLSVVNLNTFENQKRNYYHLEKICNGANMICT